MAAGMTYPEVAKLNLEVHNITPEKLIKRSSKYWQTWIHKDSLQLQGLPKTVTDIYNRSLLILRTQIDNHGAIIAANDSDNMQFNRDTYSYMWPRDGALIAITLIKAGFYYMTEPFFEFCRDVLYKEGCLLHKYNPDKTLGSSWHPWVLHGDFSLPIQEDETALVLHALWEYYRESQDKKFNPTLSYAYQANGRFPCAIPV